MSKYHLTEAYGNLYNPRKADETFYENLRFVDYLMQEEIEEVMESLLWEFMDYGNTLDESYGLIGGVFSDDVILEEIISEAYEDRYPILKKQADKARKAAKAARWQARKSAVTNALKKAYGTVKNVVTGAGRDAMGGLRTAKSMAGTAYDRSKTKAGEAQAGLAKLVRKGASKVSKAGRQMQKSGEEAQKKAQTSAAGASYGGSSVLTRSKARTAGIEAASKTGSKRKTIGRILRKAAAMVGRAGRGAGETKPMSRADLAANNARRADAARQAIGDPFSSNTPTPTPKKPSLGLKKLEASGTKPVYNPAAANRSERKRTGGALPPSTPLTPWNKGPDKSGKASTAPTTVKTERAKQIRLARTQREDYELLAQYILEDFINAGYADTYEDAFEILENLSEGSIVELTEMYLEG